MMLACAPVEESRGEGVERMERGGGDREEERGEETEMRI